MLRYVILALIHVLVVTSAAANPYFDPNAVPRDGAVTLLKAPPEQITQDALKAEARDVLRVSVKWNSVSDTFTIESLETESSGTDAFVAAARYDDPHGSFKARLVDPDTNRPVAYAVIGTGVTFKHLARVLTFRFPKPTKALRFELRAEDTTSGEMNEVLNEVVSPSSFKVSPDPEIPLDVRMLLRASKSPKLIVNIYAEGYPASRKEQFFQEAAKVPATLTNNAFPMAANMEFRAVFAPSRTPLGAARHLGLPVPVRDSFLGLYFPYWHDFGRYYHVLYPTSVQKYRRALGAVPYDYPIALVDDDQYWGVGNFKELTAIPARHASFSYLLLHEFGHFFGLNEEYDGGGPTELAFAPEIKEPWSQNITFEPSRDALKWRRHVPSGMQVPTPASAWRAGNYGAYPGGYAETPKPGDVFKPGMGCTMDTGTRFCAICTAAVEERVKIDLGLASPPPAVTACACSLDADGKTCNLKQGGDLLASTPLFGGKPCDEAFCRRYFVRSLNVSCGGESH